jgi:hypothetical protein
MINPEMSRDDKTGETPDNNTKSEHIGIFAEDSINALDVFGKACEEQGLNTAIAIIEHPVTGKPVVFIRGHLYDAGVLAIKVVNDIKKDLLKDLDIK